MIDLQSDLESIPKFEYPVFAAVAEHYYFFISNDLKLLKIHYSTCNIILPCLPARIVCVYLRFQLTSNLTTAFQNLRASLWNLYILLLFTCSIIPPLLAMFLQVACRDFPHSRHLCSNMPFGTTSHEKHCTMVSFEHFRSLMLLGNVIILAEQAVDFI